MLNTLSNVFALAFIAFFGLMYYGADVTIFTASNPLLALHEAILDGGWGFLLFFSFGVVSTYLWYSDELLFGPRYIGWGWTIFNYSVILFLTIYTFMTAAMLTGPSEHLESNADKTDAQYVAEYQPQLVESVAQELYKHKRESNVVFWCMSPDGNSDPVVLQIFDDSYRWSTISCKHNMDTFPRTP